MKNKLTDLNDYLFMQLERLNDEDLTPEALQSEIARAGAIVHLGKTIVANGQLVLDATELATSMPGSALPSVPAMLTGRTDAVG
jgi:hypothetical protein